MRCREQSATAWVTTLEPVRCDGQRDYANGAREQTQPSVALVRTLGAYSGMSEISGSCADLDAGRPVPGPSTVRTPQNRLLFSSFGSEKATVAENIRFGRPEATPAEVEAAARAIGAEPVILALPHGYDTEVGERGALLSAGERQLVAFARAWLGPPWTPSKEDAAA